MKTILVFVLIFKSNLLLANLDAHVHGVVNLDIAVDKKQLLVMLKSPSESFLGFEYKAKTKKEISLVKKVKTDWKKNLFRFLGKDTLSDCKTSSTSWKQKFSGKAHSTIYAESYIDCLKAVTGRTINISLKSKYKNIKQIKLQLIREDGSAVSETKTEDTFKLKL